MNHFPLWFPNTQRSELFPQVTVMKGSLAQVKSSGFTEGRLGGVFTGRSVKDKVKRFWLKRVGIRNGLHGKNDAPLPDPILCGIWDSPFLGRWAYKDWREVEVQTYSLLPSAQPLVWGCALKLAANSKVKIFLVVIQRLLPVMVFEKLKLIQIYFSGEQ